MIFNFLNKKEASLNLSSIIFGSNLIVSKINLSGLNIT
jgi:hypothetical protein